MRTNKLLSILSLSCLVLMATGISSRAQTVVTANYIGPASGGLWNTAANWDTGLPPGFDANGTTNAFIGPNTNVSYNVPMTAVNFGILTNYGVLNINTNGFNCGGIYEINPGGDKLFLTNSGTIVNDFGNLTMGTNANVLLSGGASLTLGSLVIDANTSSKASGLSVLTNNGGILMTGSTTINNGSGTGTGLLMINGGTNNLGNVGIGRNNSAAAGMGLGLEGLVINNGLVNMTNLNVGNGAASSLSAYITGGIVTNSGAVSINQGSSGRFSRFLQTGGLFVVPDPAVVNPNPTVSGSVNNYTINGGTNIVGGFYLGNTNGSGGNVNFTNAAVIYVGSQGINWNGAVTLNAILRAGGLFGATADWAGLTALTLNNSGTFTFQAGDGNGTAHNITLSGAVSGPSSISLTKTGNGSLTFGAANSFTGSTVINSGSVVVGASGSLASPLIVVGSGTTFDVSALAGAYTPVAGQVLAGYGSVVGLVTATSGTIQPGSNSVTGTLTLTSGLTESGGAANKFILSNDPVNGSNDLLSVTGDLTVSGANTVTVVGSLPNGANYTLIKYTGNFNGTVANFTLAGVTGYLTNVVATKSIVLHTQATTRGPSNIVWVGNPVNNFWDTTVTTNWLNAGVLDYFVTGDSVLFNAAGAAVTNVDVVGSVSPANITVDATTNYVFTGNGSIDGIGGLTKTNSGTLTILTTNTYTGPTTINGGVLEVYQLANSLSASPLGAPDNGSGNLVISNGTFRYAGPGASTDRGATLASTSSVVDVSINGSLTIGGTLAGNGGLTKIDNGTLILGSGNSYTGNTTINGGVLQLNDANAASTGTINFSNGTLAYYPGGGIVVANPFNFTAGTSNTIAVTSGSGGVNPISGGNWSGSGIAAVNTSFNPYTVNGSLDAFTGTIVLTTPNGSGFRFNSGGGNTCFGSTNATFDLGLGTAALLCRNAGTMNLGALQGDSGTFLQGQDAGSGTVVWAIGYNNLSTIFSGVIQNNTAAANRIAALTKLGTGTLTLAGQSTYTGTTTVSNGVLALAYNPTNGSDGSISSSAQINILPGAILDVSGTSNGKFSLGSSQQLIGRGTINGILDTSNGGTVAPGGGPGGNTGTLTVTNSINLGGTVWIKLNGTNSDRLVSSLSTITYGGTLILTNIGAGLHVGETFTLFSGGGLSASSFSTIIQPDYYTLDTTQLGVNGTVTVSAVLPPPTFAGTDFSGLSNGSITLNAINGFPGGPVIVFTSTNLAPPLTGWTPISTNNFDGSGNLSLQITVNPNAPQSYYLMQAY